MEVLNEDRKATDGIKAETLISLMEVKENVDVHMCGIFSRNYSADLISFSNEGEQLAVELSRDGIFHLLPEGLFFKENTIKNISKVDFKTDYIQFVKEKEQIKLFFKPFDTVGFNLSLELENILNDITEKGNEIFIHEFLDDMEMDLSNVYISRIKHIVPFIGHLRGNLKLLTELLKNILSVRKIELIKIKPFHMRFIIHREGLSKEEYYMMDDNVESFFVFFRQWFLPIEATFDFKIKDYEQPFILGAPLLLDYNTNL